MLVDQQFPVLTAESLEELLVYLCGCELPLGLAQGITRLRVLEVDGSAVYIICDTAFYLMLCTSLRANAPAFVDISDHLTAPRVVNNAVLYTLVFAVQEEVNTLLQQALVEGKRWIRLGNQCSALQSITLTTLTGCWLGYPIVYTFAKMFSSRSGVVQSNDTRVDWQPHPTRNCLHKTPLEVHRTVVETASYDQCEVIGWSVPATLTGSPSILRRVKKHEARLRALLQNLPVKFTRTIITTDQHVSV